MSAFAWVGVKSQTRNKRGVSRVDIHSILWGLT